MGRGYRSRREGNRKPKRKVVIVCEGEKTEINYFNGFKTRGSGVEIIPVHGKCVDPKSIVDFAEERKESRWDIDPSKGDGLWCVFDVDENTNHVLKNASDHAKTEDIQIALSNPCIELWFLLHYKPIWSQLSRHEVKSVLKTFIRDYEKNKTINHLLEDKLGKAIDNAKKLNKTHGREGIELVSRESNPSSQVFQLIEFIRNPR